MPRCCCSNSEQVLRRRSIGLPCWTILIPLNHYHHYNLRNYHHIQFYHFHCHSRRYWALGNWAFQGNGVHCFLVFFPNFIIEAVFCKMVSFLTILSLVLRLSFQIKLSLILRQQSFAKGHSDLQCIDCRLLINYSITCSTL